MRFSRAALLGLWTCLIAALPMPHSVKADALRRIDDTTTQDDDESDHHDRTRGGGNRSSSRSSWSSHDDDDDDDDDGESVLAQALLQLFILPWSVPHLVIDDPCIEGYAAKPYQGGQGILRSPYRAAAPADPDPYATPSEIARDRRARCAVRDPNAQVRPFALQLSAESGYALVGVVPATWSARILMPGRIELSARTSLLTDVRERPRDYAFLTTALFTFRFAQAKHIDFRTGAGLRHYRLDAARFGFDVMYGIDFYSQRHVVGHIELHGGSLGKALVGEARMTLGAQIDRVELYAGYDHTSFHGPGNDHVAMGGPIAGLRASF